MAAGESESGDGGDGRGEPLFCYMMVAAPLRAGDRTRTYIGVTRYPLRRVAYHNTKRRPTPRNTRAAAGSWRLRQVIGPLENPWKFCKDWRALRRGQYTRAMRGMELREAVGATVYIDTELIQEMEKAGYKITQGPNVVPLRGGREVSGADPPPRPPPPETPARKKRRRDVPSP